MNQRRYGYLHADIRHRLVSAMPWRKCHRCRNPSPASIRLIFIGILLLLIVMVMILEAPNMFLARVRLKIFGSEISCYRDVTLDTLPDISDQKPPPIPGQSIFFHETSCRSRMVGRIMINGRQACAVESAALLHPHRTVYLLFTSPGGLKPGAGDDSDVALSALLTYSNVQLGHLDFSRYVNNTPLEHLYTSGTIELSEYAGSHASDVLRYLTLWKYGGVYLDLDVVMTKKLDDLGSNYAGSESKENVAAGVIGLAPDGVGHRWARDCLDDLSDSFSGQDWGHNGPGVITRLLRRVCGVERAVDMTEGGCGGFRVMPPTAFYPIPWWDWARYFDSAHAHVTLDTVHDSYAIHVWNRFSHATEVPQDSAYARIAREFCPRVYTALAAANKQF